MEEMNRGKQTMGLPNELLAVSAAVKRVIVMSNSGKVEENRGRYGEKAYLSEKEMGSFASPSDQLLVEFTKSIKALGTGNYGVLSYRLMDIVLVKFKEKVILIITEARKGTMLAENLLDRVKSYL
jgi:hypothetical protein